MPEEQDQTTTLPERVSRLRDNKRRHRARHKEYVSDLERRLAEVREQGVQATREVQLAAQLVVRENASLRELLRRTGVDDEAIDACVRQGDVGNHREPRLGEQVVPKAGCNQEPACSLTPKKCTAKSACGLPEGNANGCGGAIASQTLAVSTAVSNDQPRSIINSSAAAQVSENVSGLPRSGTPEQSSMTPYSAENPRKSCGSSKLSLASPTGPVKAPCKFPNFLLGNPTVDITQVPFPTGSSEQGYDSNSNGDLDGLEGVECGAAYKMLMQYATSEEKMDEIAQALDEGCTLSKGGGCKVRKSVVWKVLEGAVG